MLTLLPAPFSCLYGPVPCPVGDHLHTTGEETTIYEALPCAQCRVLNDTAAATVRRHPQLGHYERILLTGLVTHSAARPLPAVSLTDVLTPDPRPAQAVLTQSARFLVARALAVVTHLPCLVVQRTGLSALRDTAWIEVTTVGAVLITLPLERRSAAHRNARETVITEVLAQTSDRQAALFQAYTDRLQRLLIFLILTLQGLHPRTQRRPHGQGRLRQCTIAIQHLRRIDAHRYAAVMEACDAPLADSPRTAQCRPTTGDDHPDRDEYCRGGSRDREN
jgi:hypothetical protein